MADKPKKNKIVNPHKFNVVSFRKDIIEPLIAAAELDAKEKFSEWKDSYINKTYSKLEVNKVKVFDATSIKFLCYMIELILDDFSRIDKNNNSIYSAKTNEKRIEVIIEYLNTNNEYDYSAIEAANTIITKLGPISAESQLHEEAEKDEFLITKLSEIAKKKGAKISQRQVEMIRYLISTLIQTFVFYSVNLCVACKKKNHVTFKDIFPLMVTLDLHVKFLDQVQTYMNIKKPAPAKKKNGKEEKSGESGENDDNTADNDDNTADNDDNTADNDENKDGKEEGSEGTEPLTSEENNEEADE